MKNSVIYAGLALLLAAPAMAQTSFDAAYLYGQELIGTARYVAMGGAMGALGSDASVISQNPAGIGTYHQGDVNVGFSMRGTQSLTNPLLTAYNPGIQGSYEYYSKNRKSGLAGEFDMLSVILCSSIGEKSYANLGFVCRRLNGTDRLLDYIDSFDDDDGYRVSREFLDHRTVNNFAYDFNISCNFEDILYLGGTLEVQSTDVLSTGYFFDYYDKGAHPEFDEGLDVNIYDNMWSRDDGRGLNLSLGVIVRPVPVLRLGAAIKTPTRYFQCYDYEYEMVASNCQKPDAGEDGYVCNGYDYRYTSPWSTSLSAGLTVGTTAIGMELERHYTGRSFVSTDDGFIVDNQGACQYRDFTTFRLGIETNIDKFSIRTGFCHNGSMFAPGVKTNLGAHNNDVLFDYFNPENYPDVKYPRADFQLERPGASDYLSFGLGYCSAPDFLGAQFYADMAYVHGVSRSTVGLDEYGSDPEVDYKYKSNRLMFTLGWCF